MRPSSVPLPVATTTPVPRPDETKVPENAMPFRSPTVAFSATALIVLSIGTDSPVSAASSVRRFLTSTRRRSAGMRSPDSSSTTSPGTSSSAGIKRVSRRRIVLASAESMLRIESCFFRFAFLEKPEQGVDDHDPEDDRSVEPQTDHQLYKGGSEQDIDEDIVELGEKSHQRHALLPLWQ